MSPANAVAIHAVSVIAATAIVSTIYTAFQVYVAAARLFNETD